MVRGLINLRGQIVTAVDVIPVEEDTFERTPETLGPTFRELVSGVYKLSHQLLLVLNTERMLSFAATTEHVV